jgi:hypothetical protein
MKQLLLLLLLILQFQFCNCQDSIGSSNICRVDFNKLSVLDYIKLLPVKKNDNRQIHVLTIYDTAKNGWIKVSDIDTLITMIDSKDPSQCVIQVISSFIPENINSTIGGQVMNLIDTFRYGKEYPYFLADCSSNDIKRKQDIMVWYNNFKIKK